MLNLSPWPSERVEALRRLLKGEYDLHPGSFEVESGKSVGAVYAIRELFKRLGLDRAIGYGREAKLVQFMICARVAAQGSRLSAVRWAKNHAIGETFGLEEFDEDDLYQALDWLSKHQERIEETLYRNYLSKHGIPPVLVLYDVTSSYFEGQNNELAEYGYNRDGKRGKKQVVIGLLADTDGEPLAVRVFRGNTNDVSTVGEQISILQAKFGIDKVVFVGDRGMIKSNGKAQLLEQGYSYITALTDPQVIKLLRSGVIQLELFDDEVHEVSVDGLRYVLRRNKAVCKKENRRREDKLRCLRERVIKSNEYLVVHPKAKKERQINSLQSWINRHKLKSFVTLAVRTEQIVIEIDEEALKKDSLLDGCYVLETQVPKEQMTTLDVNQSYRNLQKVERDFRTMKTGLLNVRPIFLRKGNRTQAHVFITMMALMVTREMENCLAPLRQEGRIITVANVVETLSRLTLIRFVSQTTDIEKLPQPDEEQRTILKQLRIDIPAHLM